MKTTHQPFMIMLVAALPLAGCTVNLGSDVGSDGTESSGDGDGDTGGDGDGDGDSGGDGDGDTQSCPDGTLDCPCYDNNTCNDGLDCTAGICEPAAGDGDGDTTGDGDGDTTGDGDGDTTGDGDGDGDGDPCASVPDDMVCIPAGTFEMGSDLLDLYGLPIVPEEKPAHQVTISQTFWLDRTEVTADAYALCWGAQVCTIPSALNNDHPTWAVPGKGDHPINGINWYQAKDYCEWKGKRLPTEAEWEYAARGDDGRMFPWGDEAPTCEYVVSTDCGNPNNGGTAPVGSKPMGASPFGALDMMSGVTEWCADYYQSDYYYMSPDADPQGPMMGTTRVVRTVNGFWGPVTAWMRATMRGGLTPNESSQGTGFRCAQTPP